MAGGWLTSTAHLLSLMERLSEWDCYVQLNPTRRRDGAKAYAEDVSHYRWMLIDVDPGEGDIVPWDQAADCLMLRLHEVLGVTGHLIFSGRGFQIWVPADGRVVTPEFGARIWHAHGYLYEVLQKPYLDHLGWKIDTRCRNLDRLARMPGTINQRTGVESRIEEWWELFDPTWVDRLLAAAPEVAPAEPVEAAPLHKVWHLLTVSAKRWIEHGAGPGERHDELFRAAASLAEAGVPIEDAIVALDAGNAKCRNGLRPNPLPHRDIVKTAHSAYRRRFRGQS